MTIDGKRKVTRTDLEQERDKLITLSFRVSWWITLAGSNEERARYLAQWRGVMQMLEEVGTALMLLEEPA